MYFYANGRRVSSHDLYREFEHISKDVASKVREFWEGVEHGVERSQARPTSWPVADVSETTDAVIVRIELPGVAKESVEITYKEEGAIEVKGVKTITQGEGERVVRSERKAGEFTRVIPIPNARKINDDGVTATLENGVLEIRLPKSTTADGVTVEIR